jgi:hypothetical protein
VELQVSKMIKGNIFHYKSYNSIEKEPTKKGEEGAPPTLEKQHHT